MSEQAILSRITRDISDGIIVLDLHGTVSFINPIASKLLGNDNIKVGQKYAEIMMSDGNAENDKFHQFLLDSIYDKHKTHKGKLSYYRPDTSKRIFNLTCSFLFSSDGKEKEGVVIQFTDITKEAELQEMHQNTTYAFITIVAILCVWIFFYAVWELLNRPIKPGYMTMLVEITAITGFLILKRVSTIKFSDIGLGTTGVKSAIIKDSIATVIVVSVMVAIKIFLLCTSPHMFLHQQIFDFSDWDIFDTIYPLTVILQEFLSRGIMHETIKNLIPGKYANAMAIIVSSLFFGAIHIYLGIVYMVGAALLLAVFGVVYTKQRTIWGLCIPHFVLGILIKLLFTLK